MYTLFFIYFSCVTILPFRPFVFLLMYSNNGTPFDTSAYYTDGVILYNIIIIIFVRLGRESVITLLPLSLPRGKVLTDLH